MSDEEIVYSSVKTDGKSIYHTLSSTEIHLKM
nr:MAG TPA: hypothetical protein [Caudoviricetes sp.]